MNRLQRLSPIVGMAETREREAARALGLSVKKLEDARKSLDSLGNFRDSYGERFRRSGEQGLSVRQLAEYRVFLAKINQAIVDQEKALLQAESDVHARRRAWEDARAHLLGLQKLAEKLRLEAAGLERKREQAELDERAARRRN